MPRPVFRPAPSPLEPANDNAPAGMLRLAVIGEVGDRGWQPYAVPELVDVPLEALFPGDTREA